MRLIYFLLLYILVFNPLLSQNINLLDQEQIDRFKQVYGNIKTINSLSVGTRNDNINNFDSLDNIEYIGRLSFIHPLESLKSLSGFKNFRKADFVSLFMSPNDSLSFPVLDTVGWIWMKNTAHPNISIRPTYFKNTKYITETLTLDGNLALEDFPYFNHNTSLTFDFMRFNNLDSFRLKNNRFERIKGIYITGNNNVSYTGFRQLDYVNYFILDKNSNCDLKMVSLIKSIKKFEYRKHEAINIFGEGFKHIYVIDSIKFTKNKVMPPFTDIFPNPLLINDRIYIEENPNLTSITDFNNIYIYPGFEDSIVIRNNRQLNNCNVDFLCKALEYIPERTVIRNNGDGCTIEEIRKYCLVNTSDLQTDKTSVFPNPTDGYFKIDGLDDHAYIYKLYHPDGRIISTGHIQKNHSIDINNLERGVYLIEVFSSDSRDSVVHKIVKMH